MHKTIRLNVVNSDKTLFEGDVTMVTFPSCEGDIGVMHNHAPFCAISKLSGNIRVYESDIEHLTDTIELSSVSIASFKANKLLIVVN